MKGIRRAHEWTVLLGVAAAFATTSSCGSGGPAAGDEGGDCYGNGTCNDGLVCLSDLCVDLGGLPDGGGPDAPSPVPDAPGPDVATRVDADVIVLVDADVVVLVDADVVVIPDAASCLLTPCGPECVDTTADRRHCGACFNACSPASSCEASACVCPPNFVPATIIPIFDQMDTTAAPPDVIGLALYSFDGLVHALLVASDPSTVPLGVDIDLSGATSPFVRFGYDLDTTAMEFRSAFAATAGTLNLSRSCDVGVAGALADVVLSETDVMTGTPIAGGCLLDLSAATFDVGTACP